MTFFIRKTKQKAHQFLVDHLAPIHAQLQHIQEQQQADYQQTLETIGLLANYFNPSLLAQFPRMQTGGSGVTNDITITPNYHKLLQADDVFLLSYPRSGNTWMRAIVAYLLYPAHTLSTLKDLDKYVPDLHVELPLHTEYSSPRVFKSHHPYSTRHAPDNPALYRRYIYVLRHPYKVIESFYHFESYRIPNQLPTLDTFVDLIINNAYYYGGWAEHIASWQYTQKYAQSTLFIRYEDLQKHTLTYIQHIASFLGLTITTDQAQQVKDLSSQENMRELDAKGQILPGFEMVRAGEQRQLNQKLSDDMKQLIYTRYQQAMTDWGYTESGAVLDEYPLKKLYEQPERKS